MTPTSSSRPGSFITLSTGLAFLLLAGCATSPEPRFYTLNATVQPAATPAVAHAAYRVAVGPVTVPDGIDRAQLVVRTDSNRVELYDERRWTESLKTEIPRVIAQDLAARLPDAQVAAYPQYAADSPDYTVRIDMQRFEGTLSSHVAIEALWTVKQESSGKQIGSGRAVIREAIGDDSRGGDRFDMLVSAYNQALATLSDTLAESVRNASNTH